MSKLSPLPKIDKKSITLRMISKLSKKEDSCNKPSWEKKRRLMRTKMMMLMRPLSLLTSSKLLDTMHNRKQLMTAKRINEINY